MTHGGSLFLRREVLRVIEQHGPDNLSPRYATIYRGETPVAVLAGQIVRVTSKHLHRDEAISKNAESKNLLKRVLKAGAVGTAEH